jgi:hypothetical protein
MDSLGPLHFYHDSKAKGVIVYDDYVRLIYIDKHETMIAYSCPISTGKVAYNNDTDIILRTILHYLL